MGTNIKIDHINLKTNRNKYGNVSVGLNYNNDTLVMQTPYMSLPWNLSCYQSSNRNDTFSLSLSFKGIEESEEIEMFFNKLNDIDKFIVKQAIKNKNIWFGNDLSDESIKELYNPIVKHSIDKNTGEPDGKYPPTIKIKIPFRNNKFNLKVYDASKKEIDLNNMPLPSLLVKEKEVKVLLEITNIWIMDGKFGCNLNAVQIKIANNTVNPSGFLNNESDESEDEYDVSSDDE